MVKENNKCSECEYAHEGVCDIGGGECCDHGGLCPEFKRIRENVRINHCIMTGYMTTNRRNWDFTHNRFKNDYKYFPIPLRFKDILFDKREKWKKNFIEFTVAHDLEHEIWTIAIVHPRDNFNRKIGYKIVTGRLRRTLDDIKPYNQLPPTIYQLTK